MRTLMTFVLIVSLALGFALAVHASSARLVLESAKVTAFNPAVGGIEIVFDAGGVLETVFCPQDHLIYPGLLFRTCEQLLVGDIVDVEAQPATGVARSELLRLGID